MRFIKTKLQGLYIIEPESFVDDRGRFYRMFCKNELNKIGHNKEIVQINRSLSTHKGAVRGMHFQYPPKAEIKIITCIKGKVFDIAIDLRKNSPTFLQWYGQILSGKNMMTMYLPERFAHGFQTLEKNSELLYFHSEFYSPEYEGGIRFDDPLIGIEWPIEISNLSEKDKDYKFLTKEFEGL